MKPFAEIVNDFEKTRKFVAKGESEGFMSDRQSSYELPTTDPATLKEIEADRKFIKSLKIIPDETFEIPRGSVVKYPWKPDRIELYNISSVQIAGAVDACIKSNRTLRTASIHGAAHSFSMLLYLIQENIHFDFANYINLPGEMPGEREFVLYYAVHLLKVPFVMIVPQDTVLDYYYRTRILPTAVRRWCTRDMKIRPFERFAKSEMYSRVGPGQYIDIVNFMGMQSHQSTRRAKMSQAPTPALASIPPPKKRINDPSCAVHESGQKAGKPIKIWINNWPARNMADWFKTKPNARVLRQFNMLPVFHLSEDDNRDIIENAGGIRNPNEREYGTHGCLVCPFKKIPYYLYLKEKHPDLWKTCLKTRDEATRARVEEGTLEKTFTQFTKADVEKYNDQAEKAGKPRLEGIPF